jgi:threonine aldolase
LKSFASDNYAGVLPEVMNALTAANVGHARSYGADDITERTRNLFCEAFGADVDVYFVYNGTGANVLSVMSTTRSYQSVLCSDTAHFYNDESSAPETLTGCRFFPLPADDMGKLTPAVIEKRLIRKGDIHYAQPAIISVTQSTEYGTVYSLEELKNIGELAKTHGLYFHVDGSRFFNAAASLGCSLKELATDTGIDILSLGGTKAGMMFGEAVVVFNEALKKTIPFQQKQAMQLHSKTRFIAAQFDAMLHDELWRKTASHANAMAAMLGESLAGFAAVRVIKPVQANAVFATLPLEWNEPLMDETPFYVWKDEGNEVRLMCAWDTTPEDVQQFINAVKRRA